MFVFRHDETIGKKNRGIPANKFFSDAVAAHPSASAQTKNKNKKSKGSDGVNNNTIRGLSFHRTALETITERKGCSMKDSSSSSSSCLAASAACNLSTSTSYSTELSSFSLNSDDSGSSIESEEDEVLVVVQQQQQQYNLGLSNVLYKPTFDSPVDRLVHATDQATPKREAMDIFHKLQTWLTIEARIDEIETYSWEIRNRAIPELFEYIRFNVDDKECVSEALVLVQILASSCCHHHTYGNGESRNNFDALHLIEARAINVLVLALLSHNNHNTTNNSSNNNTNYHNTFHFAALQQQHKTYLFQRLWNFLIEIILSPSAMEYFQRCDDLEERQYHKQQKHYQRMRLVTAVDLCLDRVMFSSLSIHNDQQHNHCPHWWMEQIFNVLAMLLRTENTERTIPRPNDDVRMLVWEKQIALKCQQIMVKRMDEPAAAANSSMDIFTGFEAQQEHANNNNNNNTNDGPEREELSMQALSVFGMCLGDRDDGLSESLEGDALENLVYRTLPKFPRSVFIQTKGCQILNDLASKRRRRTTVSRPGGEDASHGGHGMLPCPNGGGGSTSSSTEINEPPVKHETNIKFVGVDVDSENKNESDGQKENLSFINLVKMLLQRPCLCDDALNLKVQTQ